MKKYKILFILSLFSLALGSCGQTPSAPPAPNRYIVMYTTSSDYTINGLKENYGYQEEVSFTVTVNNSQKEIDNVKADNDVLTPTDSIYKFSMPEHDVSLTINLKNKPLVERYRVTYTSSSEYTVNGLKEEYEVNEEVSFSITVLNSSKEVDTVLADSTSLTPTRETYKFNMPSHNVSLTITLKEKTPIPENVYPYIISYDLGTKTTAQAFNAGDEDKLLSTFVLSGKESSVISSINGFDKMYGGGNGGSGDNRWYAGDMLKFGTGSYNAYIDFELTMPVNKVKVTGLVSASSCIVRAGDPTSVEWDAASHDVDGKTSAITLGSSFNIANKTNVESKNYSTFELEFEPMTSLRFGTSSTSSSKKVLYVTSIEFYVAKINKVMEKIQLETALSLLVGIQPLLQSIVMLHTSLNMFQKEQNTRLHGMTMMELYCGQVKTLKLTLLLHMMALLLEETKMKVLTISSLAGTKSYSLRLKILHIPQHILLKIRVNKSLDLIQLKVEIQLNMVSILKPM